MRLRWFGQSAFLLSGERRVAVDPFGDMSGVPRAGARWTIRRSTTWRPTCCW